MVSDTSPAPPSGEQVELRHGRQRLVVVSGGGGIRSYTVDGRHLLDGFGEDEPVSGGRGQLLVPWPNRIRDGRYRFGGAEHQVALTEPDQHNAIHGFTRDHTWVVTGHGGDTATLEHRMVTQPGYPWTLQLRVDYRLDGDGVSVRIAATNRSATAAPYASGAHPYLRPGDSGIADWTLQAPGSTWLVSDDRQIPVGEEAVDGTAYDFREPRRIGDSVLDTAFGGLRADRDGRARVVVADPASGVSLTLWMDTTHPYLMLFTGDTLQQRRRQAVGVEPMTCAPNAFASGAGLTVLQPGASHTAEWGITPAGLPL